MVKKLTYIVLAFAAVVGAAGWSDNLPDGLYAEVKTSRGTFVISLAFQKTPMATANFVGLSEGTLRANGVSGKRFYDGLSFHRVVPGFVVQAGDPGGNSAGGPGYSFPDEIVSDLKHDGPGVVAMANSGPNTNGCQFYVTMRATPELDGSATVFGRVVKGRDVVSSIRQGDGIIGVKILRIGKTARDFSVSQASFDSMVKTAKATVEDRRAAARKAALSTIKTKWPGLAGTRSLLMYKVLRRGDTRGPSPAAGMTVTVEYSGKLLDGRTFESTIGREGPVKFVVGTGNVIKGWDEAFLSMKKGEKRLLVVPPELAYGERGFPGMIPPDSFLVFEIELVDFE